MPMSLQRFPIRCLRLHARGFTLIELMVTVTVLAILMGVGIPSFRSFVQGQKVKSATHDLMTALTLARSEAVKRNTNVTLAPTTADAWASGWTVNHGTGPTTVLQQAALPGLTITGPTNVIYSGAGRPDAGSTFQVTGDSSVKCVKVDQTGIPSSKHGACS